MNLLSDIWSVLTSQQRRAVVWAQVLSIMMALSTMTGIASIAPFFAVLGSPQLIDRSNILHWSYVHFRFSSRHSFEIALGLGFMALVLVSNLINFLGSFVMIRLAWQIGTELQCTLFGEYLARPYVFHTKNHSAALFNNVMRETIRATYDLLQNGFVLITNIATSTLITISVLLLDPVVAAVMVGGLAGGYLVMYLGVRNRLLRAGQVQSELFTEQTRIISEGLGAIKEILVLRIQGFFQSRFEQMSHALGRSAAHTQLVGHSPRHVMECVAAAGLVAITLLAGDRENGIGPWLGKVTFVGFAAYRLLPALQQAFASMVKIRADRAGFYSIVPDLRSARGRQNVVGVVDSSWQDRPRREIQLSGVSFRYEPDLPPATNNVSLRIPAGAAAGFVGANGSGKTTLVDLIAGLLVPAAGQIEVDGIVLDDANRADWQSRIAYVPQNVFLLDGTIEQNIALGIPTSAINRQRLLEASRLAQLDEFVRALPSGYGHTVGERGAKLSGGQRQRIGIARALYTSASMLILDEATNALDGLTEQELLSTIMGLRGRYTIILIAHRLSTMRACDVIYEFDQGRIQGSGTYVELLRSSKTFQRLTAY